MPADSLLLSGGSIIGIAGLTVVTFAVVSFTEMRRKIDEQVKRGDVPYQLRVDQPLKEVKATEQRPKQKQQAKQRKRKKS